MSTTTIISLLVLILGGAAAYHIHYLTEKVEALEASLDCIIDTLNSVVEDDKEDK